MARVEIPADLTRFSTRHGKRRSRSRGFWARAKARLLGTIAACVPRGGAIVEIGSFKGKSTVMLGKVAAHYGLGAGGRHRSAQLQQRRTGSAPHQPRRLPRTTSSFRISTASGVSDLVEAHRAYSTDIAPQWNRPISFLWIDGDHSYRGRQGGLRWICGPPAPRRSGRVSRCAARVRGTDPRVRRRRAALRPLRRRGFCAIDRVGAVSGRRTGRDFARSGPLWNAWRRRWFRCSRMSANCADSRKLRFKMRRASVPRGPLSPQVWAKIVNGGK